MIYQYATFKVWPNLFDREQKILYKQHIVQWSQCFCHHILLHIMPLSLSQSIKGCFYLSIISWITVTSQTITQFSNPLPASQCSPSRYLPMCLLFTPASSPSSPFRHRSPPHHATLKAFLNPTRPHMKIKLVSKSVIQSWVKKNRNSW